MSLGGYRLLTNSATASSSPQSTASVTPTAGSIVFIAAYIRYTSATHAAPTIAASGISSPSLIASVVATDDNHYVLHVWRAVGAANAGALTFTASGADTWDRMCWSLFELTGQNATPLVAANTVTSNPSGNRTTLTNTYVQAFAAGSAGIAFWGGFGNFVASETPRTGWTEVSVNASGGDIALTAHYRLTSDTAGDVTWPSSMALQGVIIELAASGGGGGATISDHNYRGSNRGMGLGMGRGMSYHAHPEISLEAYRREQARKHREFMAKVSRRAA